MKHPTNLRIIFVFSFALLFLFSCSDSNSPLSSNTETPSLTQSSGNGGELIVRMTDAPFPIDMIAEANVTINKIEIRRDGENGEQGNPFVTLSEKDTTLNLLDLRNGVTTTLASLEIEAGSFNLVRLFVSDASIILADSAANGQKTFDLKVPSGAQTGIKIFVEPSIVVEGGTTSELLLDFDVSKSFVAQGNPNTPAGIKGFIFKPVIRAVNQNIAGEINGMVTDSAGVAIDNAEVWTTMAGADTTFSTTFSDSTGFYALIGLPEGTYNINATKAGFDTTTVNNVMVTAGTATTVDLELTSQ